VRRLYLNTFYAIVVRYIHNNHIRGPSRRHRRVTRISLLFGRARIIRVCVYILYIQRGRVVDTYYYGSGVNSCHFRAGTARIYLSA